MIFVTSRELRLQPGAVWEKLEKEKAVIITSNGKPLGLLSELPGGDVEAAMVLFRRLRAQWALRQIRLEAQARGLDRLGPRAIQKIIRQSRKRRSAH